MQIGQKNQIKTTVTENDTAKVFGSGELLVLATPRMIALMEECSYLFPFNVSRISWSTRIIITLIPRRLGG